MATNIRISGLNEVLDSIENLADINEYKQRLGKACALVERSAKQKAPKDTGALRRSITSAITEEQGEIVGVVFTPLEYAPYVEYGTGLFATGEGGGRMTAWKYQDDKGNWHYTNGQRPQPFLHPALHESREQIKRILKGGSA